MNNDLRTTLSCKMFLYKLLKISHKSDNKVEFYKESKFKF